MGGWVQNDDDVFFSKLEREHASNACYIPRKNLPSDLRDPDCIRNFGVRHYAGTVSYSVLDFVEKNKDDLNQNLQVPVCVCVCVSVVCLVCELVVVCEQLWWCW